MKFSATLLLILISTSVIISSEDEIAPCDQPKEPGTCRGSIQRFYYDIALKRCEEFTYGGCKGNENNFQTKEECQLKCDLDGVNPCRLPPVMGKCKARMTRFFYDFELGNCAEFIYGGCGGNKNNFPTIEDCERKCGKDRGSPCKQPKIQGPCRAEILRYYYNSDLRKCKKFTYGGCDGNGNNFIEKEDCERRCERDRGNPCKQPKETGPCDAYIPRYFYNTELRKCEKFIYGGCKGNVNNFLTEEACAKRCGEDCDQD